MKLRSAAILSGLLATLVAVWWTYYLDSQSVGTVSIAQPVATRAASHAAGYRVQFAEQSRVRPGPEQNLDALSGERPPWPDVAEAAARIVSFVPPPPASRPVSVTPVAPPPSFQYVGSIEDEQGKAAFLLNGGAVQMVRPGEQLGATYRIDGINSAGLEITYLPLGLKQTVRR